MIYQSESKFQNWRALAVFDDGREFLLCIGRSTSHVRASYGSPFTELLDAEERAGIRRIVLQCWEGAADQGRWLTKDDLTIPGRTLVTGVGQNRIPVSVPAGPEPSLLPSCLKKTENAPETLRETVAV